MKKEESDEERTKGSLYLLTWASDLQVAQQIENQLGLHHRNGLLVDFPTTKRALGQAFYLRTLGKIIYHKWSAVDDKRC